MIKLERQDNKQNLSKNFNKNADTDIFTYDEVMTLTSAKKEFYNLLKRVNESHKPVLIEDNQTKNNAVIISKSDWDSIQETLYLEIAGVMDKVREREQDDSDFINVDSVDWKH